MSIRALPFCWLGQRLARLSLRFHDDRTELAFVEERAGKVLRPLMVASAVVALFAAIAAYLDGGRSSEDADPAIRTVYHMKITSVCLYVIPSLAMCLRWYGKLGAVGSERLVSIMCLHACLQVILSKPYYVALLQGSDPTRFFAEDSEHALHSGFQTALTCLMLHGVLAVAHLYLQVRWYYLLPADFVVLLPITFCFTSGGNNAQGELWSVMSLGALTLLSIAGTRTNEATQRKLFIALLRERNGRVATEFKLEQLGSQRLFLEGGKSYSGAGTDGVSLVSSRGSDQVFDLSRLEGMDSDDATLADKYMSALRSAAAVGQRQRWLIDTKHVCLTSRILGSGSFGLVVQGDFFGTPVAVKLPGGEVSISASVNLWNELGIMRHLRHPNIVAFHGACIQPDRGRMALVLELVRGRGLDELVCGVESPPGERGREQLLTGLCCALRYLHSRAPPVVHGDLKGSNVLVEQDAQGNLKPMLLDFGLSRRVRGSVQPPGGTLQYMPPEVLNGSPLDCPADVFSFGRLLFLVVNGSLPLLGMAENEVRERSRDHSPELAWPKEMVGCALWAMSNDLLAFDPAERPTMLDVHQMLQDCFHRRPGQDPPEPILHALAEEEPWPRPWSETYSTLQEYACGAAKGRLPMEGALADARSSSSMFCHAGEHGDSPLFSV